MTGDVALRCSRPGDEPALKALWKLVFGDGDALIGAFFDTLYVPGGAVVAVQGGEILSAAHLLRGVTLRSAAGDGTPAAYFYALATLPQERGRGLGRAVTAECIRLSRDRGETFCLMPGDEGLRRWYAQSCGLTDMSRREQHTLTGISPGESGIVRPLTPAQYRARREAFLAGTAHADLPENFFRFQAALCALSGGGLLELRRGNLSALACGERDGDTLCLKELLTSGNRDQAAAALAADSGCGRCVAMVPAAPDTGSGAVMAAAPSHGLENSWWGPVFD